VTLARTASLPTTVLPLSAKESDSTGLPALTTALTRGDDSAWAHFHRDFGPALFRQLLAATRGDHDLASDALQHTYLRVARHVRPCDSDTMFAAWLRTVARSALHDCLRKRRSFWQLLQRRHADPTDKLTLATADDAANDHTLAALDTALAQLSPDDRALLEAKYFSGSDVRSLADRLAITPKAAESRLTRARAELRRLLETALRHDPEVR
jgi:RNA polymerase sigma factor (sigma-70 family)